MNTVAFPTGRTLESRHQQDQREFWVLVVEGQPPERAKKMLMEAREFGFLSDQDCAAFLDALGLGSA